MTDIFQKYKRSSLTPEMLHVIRDAGTEYPFTGEYNDFDRKGTFLCRQCGLALYRSSAKFHSGCGWPSFDNIVVDNVSERPDIDGSRTEILCKRCLAHLGHVFVGEGLTPLNIRHCVNSVSLDFASDSEVLDSEEAILAGGCFWGVEHLFSRLPGVLKVVSGYSGGRTVNPSYEDICSGRTGHYEVVRVLFNPAIISYRKILEFFFSIIDFEDESGQGPDRGEQYKSVCFYYNEEQKKMIEVVLNNLKTLGFKPATKVLPVSVFYVAEDYHQSYYNKTGKQPYCHSYKQIFN